MHTTRQHLALLNIGTAEATPKTSSGSCNHAHHDSPYWSRIRLRYPFTFSRLPGFYGTARGVAPPNLDDQWIPAGIKNIMCGITSVSKGPAQYCVNPPMSSVVGRGVRGKGIPGTACRRNRIPLDGVIWSGCARDLKGSVTTTIPRALSPGMMEIAISVPVRYIVDVFPPLSGSTRLNIRDHLWLFTPHGCSGETELAHLLSSGLRRREAIAPDCEDQPATENRVKAGLW